MHRKEAIELLRIFEVEIYNTNRIYLYKESHTTWRAYEHSAYILSEFIPNLNVANEISSKLEIILTTTIIKTKNIINAFNDLPIHVYPDHIEISTNKKGYAEKFLKWKNNLRIKKTV